VYVIKHVVITDTIDPHSKNEIAQVYGTTSRQNNFYFNWQYYIKYEIFAMIAQTLIHFVDLSTVNWT